MEQTNPDYKILVDNLRTYGLMPYLITDSYRNAAKQELNKVDWSLQPKSTKRLYTMPIFHLKARAFIMAAGSKIKQTLKRYV